DVSGRVSGFAAWTDAEVDEREEELVHRRVEERRAGGEAAEVRGTRAPAADVVAVDGEDVAADAQVRALGRTLPRALGSHPKKTDCRRRLSRATIVWIVRRTRIASCRPRCHRASPSTGVSRIGFPKCMNHLVGSGSAPRTPSSGKNGVSGRYGIP